MGTIARRRLRAPVFGRLAIAWALFALAAAALALSTHFAGDRMTSPGRVALALGEEIQRFAPLETASVLPKPTQQVAEALVAARADGLREERLGSGAEAVYDFDAGPAEDILDQPDAFDFADEPDGAIVIRIEGGGSAPRPAGAASQASLSRPAALRIPDADPALLLRTPLGMRPKIAADGRRPARLYARPDSGDPARARIGLIVGGLGLDAETTRRAIEELPPEVTLAFAPYARNLEHWTKQARDRGHEIMIELPMEAHGGRAETLGPAALRTDRPQAENLERLDWLLSRFGAYFGATNYLGGKFSADREQMTAVLDRLAAAGVAYVDDTGAARRTGAALPLAIVNRMLAPQDGEDADAVERDLRALREAAERTGDAIGKAYAYDGTIEAIIAFSATLDGSAARLAPVSAVIAARAEAP